MEYTRGATCGLLAVSGLGRGRVLAQRRGIHLEPALVVGDLLGQGIGVDVDELLDPSDVPHPLSTVLLRLGAQQDGVELGSWADGGRVAEKAAEESSPTRTVLVGPP